MNSKLSKHIEYYISLCVILSMGIIGIFFTQDNKLTQGIIIIITAFFYSIWGIVHHSIHHDLSLKIVIEYSLMSLLGASIVLFVLRSLVL